MLENTILPLNIKIEIKDEEKNAGDHEAATGALEKIF